MKYNLKFFYLNTAKAIPVEDVKQSLKTYNSNFHFYNIYTNNKDLLGYYLAGLLSFGGGMVIFLFLL
jgi:hypothetical protein